MLLVKGLESIVDLDTVLLGRCVTRLAWFTFSFFGHVDELPSMGGFGVVRVGVFFEHVAFFGLHGKRMDWSQWQL
jgi:hypothetical protein